ncbi:troponin I 4-like [Dermatophagoides pteronyssinus]|uniref:Troponin I, slow skeletal muscle n=2 Tax=Dermatophagoides pteronyssinus TaxID=6956 RepID=A0ABQ8J5X6_DERPT|nr:troponin I-like [Dermatophagoides pteronyssinus]KAH9417974.1 Troponin I, slow skeletal muscle [Dermatophagoides pteronyssinus]
MADEKMAERERKRLEIRERLEAQLKSSQKKKGFMTPERKKRLRQLLRRKAADEVKRQQEQKERERQRIITERTGELRPLPDDVDELTEICKEFHNRIYKLNEEKWDLELITCVKEYEIADLQSRVNDMRGKFIIPPLKKVSKYQTQLEKMRQWTYKLAKMDMRGALKSVKKEIELDDKHKKTETKPVWVAETKAVKQTVETADSGDMDDDEEE